MQDKLTDTLRYYISFGCCDKMPQVGWLKQLKLVFLWLNMLEVQDQGAPRAGLG